MSCLTTGWKLKDIQFIIMEDWKPENPPIWAAGSGENLQVEIADGEDNMEQVKERLSYKR